MQADVPAVQPVIGGVFRCVVQVRWGDLDALNHVNNAVYFRYQDEARVQLFEQAGIQMSSERTGVLAHASCDFLKPILYPATVVVSMVLARVGRSSMEVDTIIACQDDPAVIYARGKNVMVGLNAVTGKALAWTPAELTCFARSFVPVDTP